MVHLGDITKMSGYTIPPVDVVTFGSPCQDYPEIQDNQTLSIAGKRAGMAGERSGLFSEAVRIIREMRYATFGAYPKYAVWENVPYVQKCINHVMYTNQICIAPPKNSGARLLLLCSTVHNMFLLAKG